MKRPGPDDCFYLDVSIVKQIHAEALRLFGGLDGLRDVHLLESAVAAPQASFGGHSVFADIVEVAAAYLFYICRNHPFVDGNKRAGLGACLVFLRLNGRQPKPDGSAWEELTMGVASGAFDRENATRRLRKLVA